MAEPTYENALAAMRAAYDAGRVEDARSMAKLAASLKPLEGAPKPPIETPSASAKFAEMGQAAVSGAMTVPEVAEWALLRGKGGAMFPEGTPVQQGKAFLAKHDLSLAPGERPQTFPGRVGEFAGAMAVPVGALAARGAHLAKSGKPVAGLLDRMARSVVNNPLRTGVEETAGILGAAAGGEFAENEDPGDEGTRNLYEVGGGMIPSLLSNTPTALAARLGRRVVGNVTGRYRGPGAEGRAVTDIQRKAGPDAIAKLDEPTVLPLTIGQRLQSPDVRGVEEALKGRGLTVGVPTEEVQARAREIPLRDLEGDIGAVNARLIAHRRNVTRRTLDREKRLGQEAEGNVEALGEAADLPEVGRETKRQIEAELKLAQGNESAAWAKADKKAPVAYNNAVAAHEEFLSGLGADVPRSKVVPAWVDESLAKYAEGGNRTAGDAVSFRSNVLEELRKERAADAPSGAKLSYLGKLQSALLEDLKASGAAGMDEAYGISRQLNETYRQGKVGQLLGFERTGEAAVSPEASMRSIFTGSREQVAANLDALEKASPQTLKQAEDFLRTEFLTTAFKDGEFMPKTARSFIENKKYAEALRRFPNLRQQLENATEAKRLYQDATAKGLKVRGAILDRNKSVVAAFLDADPGQEIAAVIGTKTAYKDVRKLYTKVQSDPRARQGLQFEVVRYIVDEAGKGGALTADSLRKAVAKHTNALDGAAIPATTRARFAQVIRDLERAETPVGKKEIIADAPATMLRRAARVFGARAVSATKTGGGTVQIPGYAASSAEEFMDRTLLSKIDKQAADAITAAVMDEQVMREMLSKPAPVKAGQKPPDYKHLRAWLLGTHEEGD